MEEPKLEPNTLVDNLTARTSAQAVAGVLLQGVSIRQGPLLVEVDGIPKQLPDVLILDVSRLIAPEAVIKALKESGQPLRIDHHAGGFYAGEFRMLSHVVWIGQDGMAILESTRFFALP